MTDPNGNYIKQPIPDSWKPVMAGLEPQHAPLEQRQDTEPGPIVDMIMETLSSHQQDVLWSWHGLRIPGPEIASMLSCSKQNVSQTLKRTELFLTDPEVRFGTEPNRKAARIAMMSQHALFRKLRTFAAVHLTGPASQVFPDATHTQLWAFLCQLQRLHNPYLQRLSLPEGELIMQQEMPDPKRINGFLINHDGFLTPEEIASVLGVHVPDLPVVTRFYPFLQRTVSGLYGVTNWVLATLLNATAEQLAEAGVTEWHYSAIGEAAAAFSPALREQHPRTFASALARPEHATRFTPAGLQGHWTLRALADGHLSNTAALHDILTRADQPLHWTDIAARLNRPMRDGTVITILARDQFVKVDRGTYTVRGHPWLSGVPSSVPAAALTQRRRS